MQLDTRYALTNADGTRIVFGAGANARNDADWIGYLNPDEGITGLDGADVRESAGDIIQGDGGIHYDFFHGRRPVAISGMIWPEGRSPSTINQLEQKVKRAVNAVRGDAVLRWQPDGMPAMRLGLRRQQPPRITGRRPKLVQLALVAADYRILGDVEQSTPVGTLNTSQAVTNVGDELATPTWVVSGPAGSPAAPLKLRNITTGLAITFKTTFALAAGEQLVVTTAPPYPTVKVQGFDRYDGVAYLQTSWSGLPPGASQMVAEGAGTSTWQLVWRPAWI